MFKYLFSFQSFIAIKKFRFILLAGLCLSFYCHNFVYAQDNDHDNPFNFSKNDSVKSGLVPLVAYTTDFGIIFGGMISRTDYRGDEKPFRNSMNAMVITSTRGHFEVQLKYDNTHTFGSNIRSQVNPYFYKIYDDNYFGLGNNTTFSLNKWDKNYYQIETVSFGVNYTGRKPIYRQAGIIKRLDFLLLGGISYEVPYATQKVSLFSMDNPYGYKGGWVNYIGTGFQWENVDNEFIPTRGNKALLRLEYSPKFFLSDYHFALLKASVTQYFKFHLIRDVVVANRLQWNESFGKTPFWEMPHLGNEQNMRGYPLYRFLGKANMIYNLELRTWLFSIPSLKLRIGGQLFMDAGKIYNTRQNFTDFFGHFKKTFGFGGAVSLFNRDFFVRGDLGFSPDMASIYAGIGYAF